MMRSMKGGKPKLFFASAEGECDSDQPAHNILRARSRGVRNSYVRRDKTLTSRPKEVSKLSLCGVVAVKRSGKLQDGRCWSGSKSRSLRVVNSFNATFKDAVVQPIVFT